MNQNGRAPTGIVSKALARFGYHHSEDVTPVYIDHKTVGSGVTFVGAPDWRQIILLNGYLDPDAEELNRSIALATSAYAYTAITYRASRVAEPPLMLVQDGDEGEVVIEDPDLTMLLDEPSPDYDMGELQQLTEMYRMVTGAALWVKAVDQAGRVARYVPYSGDEFRTESADGRIYGRFIVETKRGPKPYAPEEVVHFRDVNPGSWRRCLSKLDVALSQLDLGHQVNRTVRNFMRKALFPGGIISPDAKWNPDDDTWDEWKNEIEAWHSGPANAGAPLVVQGGTTLSTVNSGLKDILPEDLLDRLEAVIGSVFGIPPVVLGWKVGLENSPWSQMEQARLMTYEDTIAPRWTDVEKKMTRQILSQEQREEGVKIKFDTSDVRALFADDELRAKVAGSMRREWTLNERRAYTGQDPLPDDDPRGDGIEGGSGDTAQDDLLSELGRVTTGMDLLVQGGKAVDHKTLEWVMFDVSTKAAESTWDKLVNAEIKRHLDDILGMLGDHVQEKQLDPDSLIEFVAVVGDYLRDKANPAMVRLTLPLVVSTATTGVKRAAAQTGLSFAVLQPFLLDYADEEAKFLAAVMGETTGKTVARIVQNSLASGGTIGDLRKSLEESGAFARSRAQRIARTETTRAWNGAQRRSLSDWMKEQPESTQIYKTWLSSRDPRVREEHVVLDGERVKINDAFSNGLDSPGEPNCRCTSTYEVVTA
jgi:HK97 family phage portal protein